MWILSTVAIACLNADLLSLPECESNPGLKCQFWAHSGLDPALFYPQPSDCLYHSLPSPSDNCATDWIILADTVPQPCKLSHHCGLVDRVDTVMIPWGLIVCKIWLTVVHGGLMVTDRLVKDDFCLVIYMWPQKNQRQAYVCNLDFSRPPFKLMASVQIKYSRILVIDSFVICIAILQDPHS